MNSGRLVGDQAPAAHRVGKVTKAKKLKMTYASLIIEN